MSTQVTLEVRWPTLAIKYFDHAHKDYSDNGEGLLVGPIIVLLRILLNRTIRLMTITVLTIAILMTLKTILLPVVRYDLWLERE